MVFAIGFLVKTLLINPISSNVDGYFDMAYFTYLVLPPPFALVIFAGQYGTDEHAAMANNTIVLSTLFCVIAFSIGVVVQSLG